MTNKKKQRHHRTVSDFKPQSESKKYQNPEKKINRITHSGCTWDWPSTARTPIRAENAGAHHLDPCKRSWGYKTEPYGDQSPRRNQ